MSKLMVTEFLSLDGVMEEPAWSLSYWNDSIAKFKKDELFASGAHLLGRVTYQGFAAAWPERKDEEGFADHMNNLPKYVVSTTLDKADWHNTTIIRDQVVREISKLKESLTGICWLRAAPRWSRHWSSIILWMNFISWSIRSCWAKADGCSMMGLARMNST